MKLRYALTQNTLDGVGAQVSYAFEDGDDIVETFPDWDCAVRRMNELYAQYGLAEQSIAHVPTVWQVVGHGQDIGPAPQWTTTPPTEPGWYWIRQSPDGESLVARLWEESDWNISQISVCNCYGDRFSDFPRMVWWPVRIPEPPR